MASSRTARRGPTSKDVARRAGVSQSTVSYVMSGKRSISADTLRRVEEAMAALDYQPHVGARSLAGSRTGTIAVVMPFVSAVGAQSLMAFVEEFVVAARQHGSDVLLVTAEEGVEGLRRLTGGSVCDAALVMQVASHDERAEAARGLDFPVMFIGVPEDPAGLDCIDFDFAAGGRLLVDELVALGNRRISVLGWSAELVAQGYNYIDRFSRGVHEAAAAHRVPVDWHRAPVEGGFLETLEQGLHRDGERTGVVLTSAVPAAMRALAAQGLHPGGDVDVVALCTEAEAEEQAVPLTAVSTQPRDVSRRATERIFALLDGSATPGERLELVDAGLVRRRSTRRPAATPAPDAR